eukprot:gene23002-30194_t
MKVLIQPRIQTESWSLYWKDSLNTDTKIVEPFELDVQDSASLDSLLKAAASHLGWAPQDSLFRLEGFSGPWERAIVKGREVGRHAIVGEVFGGDQEGKVNCPLNFVRVVLKADGWKIRLPGDFLTDSDSEEENE